MSTPPRPDLTATASKPDVLVRLHMVAKLYKGSAYLIEVVTDAIAVIEGLRETCERRLATINDLKRLLQRVTLDSEWSCMAADVQADIEAALAGSRPSEGR